MSQRFQLFFSIPWVELHDLDGADGPSAKTRRFRLPRTNAGEDDANVRILRAMADAGNKEAA